MLGEVACKVPEKEREGEESMQVSEIATLVLISSLLQESPQRSKHWLITFLLLQDKETINQNQSVPSWRFLLPFEGGSLRFFLRLVACLLFCLVLVQEF